MDHRNSFRLYLHGAVRIAAAPLAVAERHFICALWAAASVLVAGCANQSSHGGISLGQSTSTSSAGQAKRLTDVTVATMVEPTVPTGAMPGAPLGPGWYADLHTGGAGMQFIFSCPITTPLIQRLGLSDLKNLAKTEKTNWLEVLNGTYLPDPNSLALLSRLAMLVGPDDPDALHALRDLEAKGHALAQAWARYPKQARELSGWMMECHREAINILAARAVRGDVTAQRAMDAMSARLRSSPVGPAAIEATHALVAAQHYMRLRLGLTPGASYAFWVLRTPSFAAGLDNVAVTRMALQQVSYLRCQLMKLPWCGTMQWQPQKRAACFPLESGAMWIRQERDVHSVACAA